MDGPTGGSWWRSPRMWVGGTALADLVARAPADIIAPVASLLGGLFGGPPVASATTWLLIVVVFYQFAPLVYSLVDTLPRDEPVFRAVFATGGVALGISIGNQTYPFWMTFLSLVVGTCAFGGLLLWYLSSIRAWALLDPHGPGTRILGLFAPAEDVSEELETALEREGLHRLLSIGMFLFAYALLLGLPIVLAGALTLVFRFMYPFPDLLFLGWAVGAALSARVSLGPTENRVLDLRLDLERFLVDALENATRGVQGAVLTTLMVSGMFFASFYLSGLGFFTSFTTTERFLLPPGGPAAPRILLDLWIDVGGTALLVSAFGFTLWAWTREWRRLPHFLDRWQDRGMATDHLVSRPPGLVALPAGIAGVVIALGSSGAYAPTLWYVFAVSWPFVLGLVGVVGLWTVERSPQPVHRENYVIAGGVLVELLSFVPVAAVSGVEGIWLIVLLISVVVFITGYPVMKRYARDATGWKRYTLVSYLFVSGGLSLTLHRMFPPDYRGAVMVMGGVWLVTGIGSSLAGRFDL